MMRWMVRRLGLYQDDGMDAEKAGFISDDGMDGEKAGFISG
jgi:hypothetical protein